MTRTAEPRARREPVEHTLEGLCGISAGAGAGACCQSGAISSYRIGNRGAHETAVGRVVAALRVAGTVAQAQGRRSAAAASAFLGMWQVRRVERRTGLRHRDPSMTPPSQRIEVGFRRTWV